MFAYHWSPTERRKSIQRSGLVIGKPSVVCSDGHRNPHLSASRTPMQAWSLSGGFLEGRLRRKEIDEIPRQWDLWEIDLNKIRYDPIPYWIELQIKDDIPKRAIHFVGSRVVR